MKFVFSIYDKKAGTHSDPFCFPSVAVALRNFQASINDNNKGNQVAMYPEDFELRCLGVFLSLTGEFVNDSVISAYDGDYLASKGFNFDVYSDSVHCRWPATDYVLKEKSNGKVSNSL